MEAITARILVQDNSGDLLKSAYCNDVRRPILPRAGRCMTELLSCELRNLLDGMGAIGL